ncbi:MAG TPA: SRPBCC family protein [Polyangiaceae bacterium]|nr:SRPBCC family protein [Polyangiaceae bacterium]
MKVDVARAVGAVTREVKAAEREGRPARVVVATRVYDTDPDDAWDALTNPERVRRWFLPLEGDLRPGGRYQLRGNAGGTIAACEPPHRLSLTWEYGGEVSWVEVRLEPLAGGEKTRLTLEHAAHVDDARWGEFGPGAVGVGWDLGLLGLSLYLDAGGGADDVTAAGQAWAGGDEGKEFIRRCSEGWCQASIAGGTDPQAARAAADRTTAFYTGGA